MLSPEVWNFRPPPVVSTVKKVSYSHPVVDAEWASDLLHSIIISLPDAYQIPDNIQSALVYNNSFYKITKCSIQELLTEDFIKTFVRKGSLACLLINSNLDAGSCLFIQNGILTLHIKKQLYQLLGAEGKIYASGFYEVRVDLRDKQLERNVNYVKLKNNLSKLALAGDVILKWKPHVEDVCPSSIAKYLYEQQLDISFSEARVKKLICPVKEVPSLDVELTDLNDWLGMLVNQCDLEPTVDYVSTYAPPDSGNPLGSQQVAILLVQGFFTPDQVIKLYSELQEYVSSRDGDYWAAITLQHFENLSKRQTYISPKHHMNRDSNTTIFCHKKGYTKLNISYVK